MINNLYFGSLLASEPLKQYFFVFIIIAGLVLAYLNLLTIL